MDASSVSSCVRSWLDQPMTKEKKVHNWPLKSLTIMCGVVFASGCAPIKNISTALSALTTAPVSRVTHGAESSNSADGIAAQDSAKYDAAIVAYRKSLQEHATSSEANYRTGRSHQDRLQYDAAIAAYRRALELNPANAEAHNALGVIFASQGKHEQAITELIAASSLAPGAAHIHNNLGYAYVLQGRNVDAVSALKVASEIDPENERARRNMKTAEKRLVDAALIPLTAPLAAAQDRALTAEAEKETDPLMPRLLTVAPNIFELRQAASTPESPTRHMRTPIVQPRLRLEVTNGSGVTGLAKRTSSSLQKKGYAIARLTNQVPYTQKVTEIQYRSGEQEQANRLNALLSQRVKLVESHQLSPAIGIRLVLGHDAAKGFTFTPVDNRNTLADNSSKEPLI